MDTGDIRLILTKWGEIPREIKMVRDVFWIKTAQGVRCLKKVNKSINRIMFMLDGIKYAESRGFSDFPRYLPAKDGEMVVSHRGAHYYLQEWVEGRELDYQDREDMKLAAETLGRFHRASIGFVPSQDYPAKDKLGKWPKKLKGKTEDLRRYIDSAEDSDNSPGFLQVVAQYGDWLLYHAEKSLERLMQSQYQDLVNEARDWGGLVHGDTAARNFLRSGNKVYLIDFDAIALDVFVTDLWRLLRRTLSRTGWETALAEEILCKYNRFVPVEARHREVLGAFLQFPEIPWRIMREYFERPDKTIRYELFLTERLENYLAQHREIERFLKKF